MLSPSKCHTVHPCTHIYICEKIISPPLKGLDPSFRRDFFFFFCWRRRESKDMYFHSLTFCFLHDCKECKYIYIGEETVPTNPVNLTIVSRLNWFTDPIDLLTQLIYWPTLLWKFTIWPLSVLYFPPNLHIWRITIAAQT